MRITLCGAAGTVTGSGYLVETGEATVLVDFGMFQGHRITDTHNRDLRPVDPRKLDAVLLTHAHLDHTGRLPLLGMHGFKGPIFGTPATGDFAELILKDSAHLQESDAARATKRALRAGREPIEPLYKREDVERIYPLFTEIKYGERREIAAGITVRLVDAGHILGSASVEMTVEREQRTVVFSGDIGPKGVPFLRDPVPLEHADLVFLESTYGGREHRSLTDTVGEFHDIIARALQRRAKVLIPTFAIGRAQQILYHLAELVRTDDLGEFPIYLDSPMAIEATKLYGKHQHLFDVEAKSLMRAAQLEEDLRNLKFYETADESRTLNNDTRPGVVLAGAGMCNGGRILHHFKYHLWRKNTRVVFVGYQAPGTLGHQLVKGAENVRIFGERIHVNAKIHTLGGFSAHAGQSELIEWVEPLVQSGARVVLTHGEEDSRRALADKLRERYTIDAQRPVKGNVIKL
ncbi:MAG: MBL fold metallo-hydrolase RNA specificity domain-containing protein [Planctomycetota bacterium]|jgi:metallo-beta-lactamase family protein